jgi:hypothetical protein
MAEEKLDRVTFIKEHRAKLGAVDEIAQIILKGHLDVEADLDDVLRTIFVREDFLKRSRLSFTQKVHLVRALGYHDDEEEGWALVFGLNALRNEIAHGQKSEKRTDKINVLRKLLQPYGDEEFKKHVRNVEEAEVVVQAAAIGSGFVLDILKELQS